MDHKSINEQLLFYKKNLYDDIVPFWMKNGIDRACGGYFTCLNNAGDQLISTDKYVWSQGRVIWVLAKLAELNKAEPKYLELAKQGVDFLSKNCFLANGHCVFLLSRDGKPKEPVAGRGYDTSIYAECFAVLGFAKYAAVSKDPAVLESAMKLYGSIIDRFDRHDFRTDPEPTPKGYKAHGVPMILLNISQEVYAALSAFGNSEARKVWNRCTALKNEILTGFLAKDNLIHELVKLSGQADQSTVPIFERIINPGHTLEDMWFMMRYAMQTNDHSLLETIGRIIEKAFTVGWDQEFGGLLHFTDQEGGKPKGDQKVEAPGLLQKIKEDWDKKLWWVHAEAMYSTLLCYHLTHKAIMFNLYQKVCDYTFKTFPNPNKKVGEWIQIRDRQGNPIEKVVALPVKDPFHISRCYINIIELLGKMGN
jgi:N-acylglucosamine 2-epimerase